MPTWNHRPALLGVPLRVLIGPPGVWARCSCAGTLLSSAAVLRARLRESKKLQSKSQAPGFGLDFVKVLRLEHLRPDRSTCVAQRHVHARSSSPPEGQGTGRCQLFTITENSGHTPAIKLVEGKMRW